MNCYFCTPIPEIGHTVTLDESESSHAAGSRRQRPGDLVLLLDGKGIRARGVIREAERFGVVVQVETRDRVEPPRPEIVVGSALPKGERQKVMLDMLTQLGVSRFTPLDCERSVVRPKSSSETRWVRVCVEACKQSQNPFLPEIDPPLSPIAFVRDQRDQGNPVYVADRQGSSIPLSEPSASVAVCVGPEGGFSTDERARMIEAGAKTHTLGPNVLRIETAVVSIVSLCSRGSRT